MPFVQILSFMATGMPVKSLTAAPLAISLSTTAASFNMPSFSTLIYEFILYSTLSIFSSTLFAISVADTSLFTNSSRSLWAVK